MRSIILLSVMLLNATFSIASDEITVLPKTPTTEDEITITLDVETTLCDDITVSDSISGNEISINIHLIEYSGFCILLPVNHHVEVNIGKLATGTYHIKVLRDYSGGGEFASTTFEVINSTLPIIKGDFDNDGQLGLSDVIGILQTLTGIRNP